MDGSSVPLTPDSIDKDSLTVTIPGTTGIGTYRLQAVKGTYAASNPVVINVKPEVRIDRVANMGETYTITGTGFGDAPPAGAEDYLNVQINGEVACYHFLDRHRDYSFCFRIRSFRCRRHDNSQCPVL